MVVNNPAESIVVSIDFGWVVRGVCGVSFMTLGN
jgi:hypothetical protein